MTTDNDSRNWHEETWGKRPLNLLKSDVEHFFNLERNDIKHLPAGTTVSINITDLWRAIFLINKLQDKLEGKKL